MRLFMWSFYRYGLQQNGVINRNMSNQWLYLLVFISLVCSIIKPALAKCCNEANIQSNEQANICNFKSKEQILIFVSFSLPDSALQSYYQEAQLLGGRLVMRGLKNNSFKDTQVKTIKLGISFDIDPTLFEEYGITTVPTIVLISDKSRQGNELSNQLNSFQKQEIKKITGHIPLVKALEIMEKEI